MLYLAGLGTVELPFGNFTERALLTESVIEVSMDKRLKVTIKYALNITCLVTRT